MEFVFFFNTEVGSSHSYKAISDYLPSLIGLPVVRERTGHKDRLEEC